MSGPVGVPGGPETPALPWTEDRSRPLVLGRNHGVCEGCGVIAPLDYAHRKRRSQGGDWSPVNALALCRHCHSRAHANPDMAKRLGWEVSSWDDPSQVPAVLWHEGWRHWFLLAVEPDGHHTLIPTGEPTP